MIALAVFDLDGTLAAPGKAMPAEELQLLLKLEEKGTQIAISSGKPVFYLCGFARQLGLKDPILIGENGAVLQKGVELPPPLVKKAPIPPVTADALKQLRKKMEERFGSRLWFQPNETALTPFPAYAEDFPPLRKMIAEFLRPEYELCVYEHPDCFDVEYARLTKKTGIELLEELTGISPQDMVAVGDYTNDYPMLEAVGHSVGIHLPEKGHATVDLPDLKSALLHLLTL